MPLFLNTLTANIQQSGQMMTDSSVYIVFLFVVAFDILTGYAKSVKTHTTNSTIGKSGLINHSLVLLLVSFLFVLFEMFGNHEISIIVTLYYILNYAVSIVENLGILGIPVPAFLEARIKTELADIEKQLKDEGEELKND